jgi:glycosyltransferase involved in cell wall biosynthesis
MADYYPLKEPIPIKDQVWPVGTRPVVTTRTMVFNHAPYLRQCIEGIIDQKTTFPFEIVIGEDESSNSTMEICIEYAKKYPDIIRLFLHKRENNILIDGKPSAKFQGTYTMYKLRGKYQAICEGDDYWTDPLKLQKQVDLEEYQQASMCVALNQQHYVNGDIKNDKSYDGKNFPLVYFEDLLS